MTIKEYLKSIGAKDNELTANVVKLMENAMLFDVDIKDLQLDTVLEKVKAENEKTKSVDGSLIMRRLEADKAREKLELLLYEVNITYNAKLTEMKQIKDGILMDKDLKDAVTAYRAVLQATVDVFGVDKLTSEVMAGAINAGSYIAWRGIMGPKDKDFEPKRRF